MRLVEFIFESVRSQWRHTPNRGYGGGTPPAGGYGGGTPPAGGYGGGTPPAGQHAPTDVFFLFLL